MIPSTEELVPFGIGVLLGYYIVAHFLVAKSAV